MKSLERLSGKKNRLVAGLMSGTSADGLDVALVRIHGSGGSSRITLLAFETVPYPAGYRAFLLRNSDPATSRIDDIARLDTRIAVFSADAVSRVVRRAGYTMKSLDLIGSHGQTIQHCPDPELLFGKKVRATLQIGNPSIIAGLTGVVTVGDFRPADIAAGGTGAPLVPFYDYCILRSDTVSRMILNIGGIANVTVLPRKPGLSRVAAFDTGPGNMAIDALMTKLFSKPYDRNGETAARGTINTRLLRSLLQHPYLAKVPPKSTGREMFGSGFVQKILSEARGVRRQDIITTVTEFTALSIFQSYSRFIRPRIAIGELIAGGGGVHNLYLLDALRRYFEAVRIRNTDEFGIPADAKEAICFALLANETISGHCGNVPRATGAGGPAVLGTIALPQECD